ncbi:MAG: NAD-dependent epimerase/dehydratase family protein, partial [Actinomycetota bacterium]|nr:NAD-dependent epimerase/dehydratase family protein [Actinomycetota bacterium]
MLTSRRPRALVIGGAGFLGSHVCESMLGEGYAVLCLDNLATGFLGNIETLMVEPRFAFLNLDISSGGPCAGDFDVVIHLAASTSPFQYSAMPEDILRAQSEGTWHALD